MPNKSWSRQRELSKFFLILLTVTLFLNLDFLHFQPLALWARLLPPVLLIFGTLGSVFKIKSLRFAGWVGIVVFLVVSLFVSFPNEDYLLGGPEDDPLNLPRTVSSENSLMRVIIGLGIALLLFRRYRCLQTILDKE